LGKKADSISLLHTLHPTFFLFPSPTLPSDQYRPTTEPPLPQTPLHPTFFFFLHFLLSIKSPHPRSPSPPNTQRSQREERPSFFPISVPSPQVQSSLRSPWIKNSTSQSADSYKTTDNCEANKIPQRHLPQVSSTPYFKTRAVLSCLSVLPFAVKQEPTRSC